MKILDLLEMPIDRYETIGDFSKNSSFKDKRDRMLITHPKSIERIKKKFDASDITFDFIFVNNANARKYTEIGKVDPDWVKNKLGEDVYNAIDFNKDKDKITIIFTNNNGSQRMPMTAWILAHRIGHAARIDNFRLNVIYEGLHNSIIENVGYILEEWYNVSNFPKSSKHMYGVMTRNNIRPNQLTYRDFFYAIGTFKSAREKKLRDWFEVCNELIAQYLTTGKITFNKAPLYFGVRGRKYYTNKDDLDDINDYLDSVARTIDYYIDMLFGSLYGSILVM